MNNKSREEILTEYGCPEIPFDENVTMFYPALLEAMKEYAEQESFKLKKKLLIEETDRACELASQHIELVKKHEALKKENQELKESSIELTNIYNQEYNYLESKANEMFKALFLLNESLYADHVMESAKEHMKNKAKQALKNYKK